VGHDTMLRRSFLSCPKSVPGSCDLEESGDGAYCLVLVAYAGEVTEDFNWSAGLLPVLTRHFNDSPLTTARISPNAPVTARFD
jgi:hypothetical protein